MADAKEGLVKIDDRHYTATLETRVAYLKLKFAVAVEIVELDEPVRVVAKVERAPGRNDRAPQRDLSRRSVEQDGGTAIIYELNVALIGKLGSLGQPVLRAKAKEMERQLASHIQASFSPRTPGAEHDGVRTRGAEDAKMAGGYRAPAAGEAAEADGKRSEKR